MTSSYLPSTNTCSDESTFFGEAEAAVHRRGAVVRGEHVERELAQVQATERDGDHLLRRRLPDALALRVGRDPHAEHPGAIDPVDLAHGGEPDRDVVAARRDDVRDLGRRRSLAERPEPRLFAHLGDREPAAERRNVDLRIVATAFW